MNTLQPILAVIPARGGSKGLPGKNLRPLGGLPLIAHSIELARRCPEIARVIVSSDSDEIGRVAREHGAAVPFLRPAELARDDTPMWPVLEHALREMELRDQQRYESLLLLDPTSPGRLPEDVTEAVARLNAAPEADGIVGVSQPEFNPIWNCVVQQDGWMRPLIPGGERYTRRQDVPTVYRINGALYLWRRDFLMSNSSGWRHGKTLLLEMPETRAIHIDDMHEFAKADALIRAGLIRLPWLQKAG